ncbi:T6SS effector BTH_I2691 family protein [Ralstonia pseudosolanacearum]|uniref:T6SS effector BTH_I2691 family protein n=1 Tax=Ralstonia pseudosolanacearum TaxID=1310165 RepID=UPI002675F0BD|nr:T6SS effector BTH_I2691 family protein [Ralstonia pseudosolanacearum]MDO3506494.1 T6SS effector BTH_I2691 family protein [Ralstonia pseudosolanacearum]MDO3510695.1 T6SS effector BTH_I2691 family protein [Ralstonia pseudosolanacearum]MDO3537371.1 T6SS effector BTH_I2691 family protein [Ralstonia pseudosolanacearum]MDO3605448.1 T6SS effector BTH_I2691 family protein [Ralstonia pseudosolanacearum]MDO3611216.1 T6SS effector BTH_I2691 family protein [Ralstonia pseudosolanacearum]
MPILFTRYSAGYSSRPEGVSTLDKFKPNGRLQAQPGGVPIKTARYGVRMLRAGYLYLRIERRGLLEWEGYAVHPHGYLQQFWVMKPEAAEAKIACERRARQANNNLIWIKDAKNVKSLWYAFHPDPIDPQHLKSEIEPNPAKYMQRFDVAGWQAGSTSQADSLEPAQLDKQVLGFAALSDEQVQRVGNEQCFGPMGMTPQQCVDAMTPHGSPQRRKRPSAIAHAIDRLSKESMMSKAIHSQPCSGRSHGAQA